MRRLIPSVSAFILVAWISGSQSNATEILKYTDFSAKKTTSYTVPPQMVNSRRVSQSPRIWCSTPSKKNSLVRGSEFYVQTLSSAERDWRQNALAEFRRMRPGLRDAIFAEDTRFLVSVNSHGTVTQMSQLDVTAPSCILRAVHCKGGTEFSGERNMTEYGIALINDAIHLNAPPIVPCKFVLHGLFDLRFVRPSA